MRYAGVKDLVLNYVFSEVIDGTHKFDRKISQKALCDNLQISRTPIREALIELTSEGVFERRLNRGFWMKRVDLEEVQEAYKIIGCLEGYAAALASDKLSREDFFTLKQMISLMDKSLATKKYREYYLQQLDFHNAITRASQNKKLDEILTSLKTRYVTRVHFMFEAQNDLYKTLKKSNDEHRHIVELLEKGDKRRLGSYLRDVHWNITSSKLIFRETLMEGMPGQDKSSSKKEQ